MKQEHELFLQLCKKHLRILLLTNSTRADGREAARQSMNLSELEKIRNDLKVNRNLFYDLVIEIRPDLLDPEP